MKVLPFLFVVVMCTACFSHKAEQADVRKNNSSAKYELPDIPVYDYEQLAPLLQTNDDKVIVVNFWAMWCAPCVKELPYYKEMAKNNPDVELLLVSLDFKEDDNKKLKTFLAARKIAATVVLLDDPDANSWINKVNPNWSGSIPFTIIFNKNKRGYYERQFVNVADLQKEVNKFKF